MKKLLAALCILTLLSCAVLNKVDRPKGLFKIDLHGTVYHPYCGGAKPDPDVAKGYYESMKFVKFKLFKGSSYSAGNTAIQEVNLDEGGNITLFLEPGDYYLLEAEKLLSTDEFMKQNGPANEIHYVVKDKSCYENWMKTPDLIFSVNNDTVIEMRAKAKCWVGINPCLEYIGPPAP